MSGIMYASNNGESASMQKFYGSYNGISKLIYSSSGGGGTGPAATSITINNKSELSSLFGRESKQISITVTPDIAAQICTATSSNTSVMKVSMDPVTWTWSISYVGDGTARLTVTNGSVSDYVDVTCVAIPPFDPTNPDWNALGAIVKAGVASQVLTLNQELPCTYKTYTQKWIVAGFEDATVQIDGVDTVVPAIQLDPKYTTENQISWASSGSVLYGASNLASFILNSVQPNYPTEFLNNVGMTKIPYMNRSNTAAYSYAKLFAQSSQNLGVTHTSYNTATQQSIEIPKFSRYTTNSDSLRIKYDISRQSTARYYWTRSLYSSNSGSFVYVNAPGGPDSAYYSTTIYVAPACNFIGQY